MPDSIIAMPPKLMPPTQLMLRKKVAAPMPPLKFRLTGRHARHTDRWINAVTTMKLIASTTNIDGKSTPRSR